MSERPVQHVQRMHAAQRVEAERERLASLLPGGSPERPVLVTSASVIEPHATDSMPCPHCRGPYRVHEHTRPVPSLRRLDVACRNCGVARALWYRIAPAAATDN